MSILIIPITIIILVLLLLIIITMTTIIIIYFTLNVYLTLGRLFPYTEMFNWLSYGQDPHSTDNAIDKDYFSHREWSFTIEDDIYIRYQSFKDKDEMIAAIQKRQPHKIDIGAVFTGCPKDHNTIKPDQFKPMERELVFDIDMTDYDDIRTCCSGAEICHRCWPYMTMAIKVIDRGRINCSMIHS